MDEQAIFAAALEQDADRRAVFLDEACGADADLRQRIENLLKLHDQAGGFFEKPAAEILGTAQMPATAESPGTIIGPYKLLQQIGEGGMGVVWMAEQTQPVQRKVALKVIKPGMDSRQVIARFEAERQALAVMDHVNIARVFDGGATDEGRPYFVMELVHGVPITKYCDDNLLTPRQRLELFVPVCHAVQHAHHKGVIHRDLKPSNVLVGIYDGRPVVKVIDFGVAKAAGQKLTEKTLFTGIGSVVGTLEYMSPEQAQLDNVDIDTRSDIYSLGVLLYELLTGSTPLDRKRLKEAAFTEMLRVIREQEPSKPSTKLSTAEGLPTLAANRGTEPAKLTKLVRGELDWIVMKALEKDRNRRYESANGFAMDAQRYLADEPVLACPPSVAYRFRKFSRRHKAGLAMTALLAVVLVASAGGLVWSWQQTLVALHQTELGLDRERAERHKTEAALAAKTVALARQAWLVDDPENARGLLDDCPPIYRNQDWHYLDRVCNACQLVLSETNSRIHNVAWSYDGRLLAYDGPGHGVKVVDVTKRGDPLTLTGHSWHVSYVAFTPDNGRCVSVAVFRVPQGVPFPPKKSSVEAKVWDLAGVKALHSFANSPFGGHVALSPDGRYLACSLYSGTRIVEIATGKEMQSPVPADGYASQMVFDPTSQLLAVVGRTAVYFLDAATGQTSSIALPDVPRNGGTPLALSSDRRLLSAALDGANTNSSLVRVWEVGTGREICSFRARSVTCVAFSPDGLHLATGSVDGTVILWNLETGKELLTFRGHKARVNALAFSPVGRRLASASGDGTVRVWDARPLDEP